MKTFEEWWEKPKDHSDKYNLVKSAYEAGQRSAFEELNKLLEEASDHLISTRPLIGTVSRDWGRVFKKDSEEELYNEIGEWLDKYNSFLERINK